MRQIAPYLNFDGDCAEAMAFYQQCLGGELFAMTFADAKLGTAPEHDGRVMHARLTLAGDAMLMASDTMPGMSAPLVRGTNAWVHLACDDDAEVDARFAALADGGTPTMAPHDAFWGARFAMLTDRFGVQWMLNHERVPAAV